MTQSQGNDLLWRDKHWMVSLVAVREGTLCLQLQKPAVILS